MSALLATLMVITITELPPDEFGYRCNNIALGCIDSRDIGTDKCQIFIRRGLEPTIRSQIIEKERLHCNGWRHH